MFGEAAPRPVRPGQQRSLGSIASSLPLQSRSVEFDELPVFRELSLCDKPHWHLRGEGEVRMSIGCFKAYDIRGRIGETLDNEIAWHIGRGYVDAMGAGEVIIGHDARASSPALANALAGGLASGGCRVLDIGQCGTEEVYFATGQLGAHGGIMVTASHNPIDYNGMKLVGPGSRPIDPATEFAAIREAAEASRKRGAESFERIPEPEHIDTRAAYATHVCDYVEADALSPIRLLANAGNGTAGLAADAIFAELARRGVAMVVERLHWTPDANFPNGIPNPLLPENRGATAVAVREAGADLGIAWDGDFDRCFFFDAGGNFIDGEYVVALVARAFLDSEPGAKIVHDPRVVWATTATVQEAGGVPVVSKTGHAFLKAAMRESGAVYGGEMSAHHYFRDFYFCDSGMIPWLKVVERMSATGLPLSELVAELRGRFPSSGEINFRVKDPQVTIKRLVEQLGPDAQAIDRLDGASLDFGQWRMNLRASNTEPLLRLNLEVRGDRELLDQKVAEVSRLIAS